MIINFSQALDFPSYKSEVYFVFDEEDPNSVVEVVMEVEGAKICCSSVEEKCPGDTGGRGEGTDYFLTSSLSLLYAYSLFNVVSLVIPYRLYLNIPNSLVL